MPKQIPSVLTNFSAYRNGNEYLGAADVDLPDLELATESISGAGIAGELDMPIFGQYGAMSVTINWRMLESAVFKLSRQESHQIDFRGSIQSYDVASGVMHIPVKVSIRSLPKTTTLGSLAPQSTMDSSNEMEIHYLKIIYDNQTVVEIDKFNYICIIDGVDYSAKIRANLGM
ncbi:phage major tail tube protein [Paenibacillus apiarius]|uniref:phage major tail tube protein n=1 Tax=Paenibacillus apiarius TaxID=46240 RepID=UPI003B3B74F0